MRAWICILVCACGGGEPPARDVPITEIPIKPRTEPVPDTVPGPACAEVKIHVATDRVTIGRTAPAAIPHASGAIDAAAAEAALDKLASECSGDATVNGDDAVAYQDLIAVMDVALAAGFQNIGIDVGIDKPRGPRPAPGSAGDALKNAPVIVVSTTEVTVNGAVVGPVGGDVTAPVAAALADKTPKGLVILQADAATPLRTIKQVIAGGRKSGFDDVLFAVKNR